MPREFELNESTSPLALIDAAQRRADQKFGPGTLFRPRGHGMRTWLARGALAIGLSALAWIAWSAAVKPAQMSLAAPCNSDAATQTDAA